MKETIKPRRLYEEPETVEKSIPLMELEDYIKQHLPTEPIEFKPSVYYSRIGDFFEIVWENVGHYAEPGKDMDLLKCFETHRVVGVKIHGCKQRMNLREVTEEKVQ